MRRSLIASAAFLACMAAPLAASASIYMDSGELHEQHTDVSLKAGALSVDITRIYNSQSTYSGAFGYGWESRYEEYLRVFGGQIIVFEYGGGAVNLFKPDAAGAAPPSFSGLMSVEDELGRMASNRDERSVSSAFTGADSNNGAVAMDEMNRLLHLGFDFNQAPPPIGSTFFSNRFGTQRITRYVEGYERERSGYTEDFDLSGNLRRIFNADGDYIAFSRNKAGALTGISDSAGHKLSFSTSNYTVRSIRAPQGSLASYTYSKTGDLTQYRGANEAFTYGYDTNHDLTRIRHGNLSETIAYDRSYNVSRIARSDGTVATFTFPQGGGGTEVYRKHGSTARGVFNKNADLVSVTDGAYSATAAYDSDDDVTSITENGVTLAIEWGGSNVSKYTIAGRGSVTFNYDDKGNFSSITGDPAIRAQGNTMWHALDDRRKMFTLVDEI